MRRADDRRRAGDHRGRRTRPAGAARAPAARSPATARTTTSSRSARATSWPSRRPGSRRTPADPELGRRPDRAGRVAAGRGGRGLAGARRTSRTPTWSAARLLTLRLLTDEDDRRDRGRADHLTARGLRRRAELGLPLLLAPRRRADPRAPWCRPGTPRRPTSGGTGCCAPSPATPPGPADHVRRRRRPPAARADLDHLPGYADSRPVRVGNGGGRPAPARRARRGDGRARHGPARPRGRRTTTPGRCSAR